jgi:hypothetical protein
MEQYVRRSSRKVSRNETRFCFEPRVAKIASPDHSLHLLSDPGIVIVMRHLCDLE